MRALILVLVAGLVLPSFSTRAEDPAKGWEFAGQAQAFTTAEVRSLVTGSMTELAVKAGSEVKKGDLLFEIDPRTYRLDLDAAQARMKMAEAKLTAAEIKASTARKLLGKNVISQEELDLQSAAAAEAKATLMLANVDAERAALTLSWTRVTAPCNGTVSHIRTTEGALVTSDQLPILTIVSTDPMYISFNVAEAILLQLRRDGAADPDHLNVAVGYADEQGHPHMAKLDLIEPEVDTRTGSVRFRATVANPDGVISPGMTARVQLTEILD